MSDDTLVMAAEIYTGAAPFGWGHTYDDGATVELLGHDVWPEFVPPRGPSQVTDCGHCSERIRPLSATEGADLRAHELGPELSRALRGVLEWARRVEVEEGRTDPALLRATELLGSLESRPN